MHQAKLEGQSPEVEQPAQMVEGSQAAMALPLLSPPGISAAAPMDGSQAAGGARPSVLPLSTRWTAKCTSLANIPRQPVLTLKLVSHAASSAADQRHNNSGSRSLCSNNETLQKDLELQMSHLHLSSLV